MSARPDVARDRGRGKARELESVDVRPELSVVILCDRAEEFVSTFVSQMTKVPDERHLSYELVLVANYDADANPPDRTPEIARELARRDPTLTVVAKAKEGMMGWDMRSGLDVAWPTRWLSSMATGRCRPPTSSPSTNDAFERFTLDYPDNRGALFFQADARLAARQFEPARQLMAPWARALGGTAARAERRRRAPPDAGAVDQRPAPLVPDRLLPRRPRR